MEPQEDLMILSEGYARVYTAHKNLKLATKLYRKLVKIDQIMTGVIWSNFDFDRVIMRAAVLCTR
jgi:hypothetical protein